MLYARLLEQTGLVEMMRKFYQRIYQFKGYKEIEEILGPLGSKDFELIPPEVMDKVAKISPQGVMTMENKGIKLAQMDQFAKQWAGEPWFKKWEMARREWLEMGLPDPDSVIFSMEEMKAFNDFRKQAMGQGLPLGGGGSGGPPPTGPSSPNMGPMAPQGMPMPPNGPGAKPGDMSGMPLG
jgi:hypothetical protein